MLTCGFCKLLDIALTVVIHSSRRLSNIGFQNGHFAQRPMHGEVTIVICAANAMHLLGAVLAASTVSSHASSLRENDTYIDLSTLALQREGTVESRLYVLRPTLPNQTYTARSFSYLPHGAAYNNLSSRPVLRLTFAARVLFVLKWHTADVVCCKPSIPLSFGARLSCTNAT
jgi:hypothetical protein